MASGNAKASAVKIEGHDAWQQVGIYGGEGEIRTHGTRKGTTVFETAAFDHSATSPLRGLRGTIANIAFGA